MLSTHSRGFSDDNVQLIQGLGAQVAVAIQNARLHNAAIRRGERLAALLRVARRFAAEGDVEQLLTELLDEAVLVLGGDDGTLTRWDESRRVLVPVRNTVPTAREYSVLAIGEGVQGRAVAQGQPVILNDYQRESGNETPAGKAGVRAATAALLQHEGRLLGAISVNTYQTNKRFTAEDAEILELLANVGAAALVGLERARLEGVLLTARTAQHELNNRLALTVGYAEVLTRHPALPTTLRDAAQEALRGAEAAAGIVNTLRRVTRVQETKWGSPAGSTINLAESVNQDES